MGFQRANSVHGPTRSRRTKPILWKTVVNTTLWSTFFAKIRENRDFERKGVSPIAPNKKSQKMSAKKNANVHESREYGGCFWTQKCEETRESRRYAVLSFGVLFPGSQGIFLLHEARDLFPGSYGCSLARAWPRGERSEISFL